MTRFMQLICGASLLALSLGHSAAAQSPFTAPAPAFNGSLWSGGADGGEEVLPGGGIEIGGYRFIPGQTVTLMRGTTVLNPDAPITVDDKGRFDWKGELGADAAPGVQPVVAVAENPAAAVVGDVSISTRVPLKAEGDYTITRAAVAPGPYQLARGAEGLFVTSTVGRPPVRQSVLSRLDPATLAPTATVTPAEAGRDPDAPADEPASLFAVYGVGLDEANGHVWGTNSQQDTIAVYNARDLSLVRQFPPKTVMHPRDVVIDAARKRAYVAPTGHGKVQVFDTGTLKELPPIIIDSEKFGEGFGTMSLALDPESGRLMTVSVKTNELAVIDPATGKARVTALPHANWSSGVAYDPAGNRVFVAAQGTGNLLIVDAADGKVIHDVYVGAGALNVAYDSSTGLAWVVSRGAGTLTAVDAAGRIVANLPLGGLPNFVSAQGGEVLALVKAREGKPDSGNDVVRVVKKP